MGERERKGDRTWDCKTAKIKNNNNIKDSWDDNVEKKNFGHKHNDNKRVEKMSKEKKGIIVYKRHDEMIQIKKYWAPSLLLLMFFFFLLSLIHIYTSFFFLFYIYMCKYL